MTSGQCTAAVTLTPEERRRLDELPGAVDSTVDAGGCAHAAGHDGPHAFLVQVQEVSDEGVHWWVVWEGPAQPGGRGHAILAVPPCWEPALREGGDVHGCLLPAGHLGDHRG
ncbi:hypothetical protein [Streptacidiphilus rugosus]|uniref:hypothetical protein n=1 Tax=Streptacidiphilus rugosus TaxID=405783 RepID=UPI0005617075|nr:hypothetical protein [Streptacidiphilus rugosus]